MSKGGRSIIAMPSTARGGMVSRIVPIITEGSAVTTPRNDVNYVVTEYGIAQLKGKTLKERTKELIKIAHPKFRPILVLEYKKRFGADPFTEEELKGLKNSIMDKIHSEKERIANSIEQKIDKIKNLSDNKLS